ncbi:MAG: DNA-binding response regulator [Zetaproteobacteria bacterium]|nr:MAG: DNA-binding response regulator [Zetaproteobacteria bacterium]
MLIDLNMPGMQGVLSIRRLAEEYPDVKMLVVSANESPMVMRACLQAGCNGYLTKSAKPSVMLSAIDLVLKGGAYIPREAFTAKPWKFSARQEQLLIQLATGLSNREIAQALGLSEGTVKQYMFALMRQLGVSNRTQACLKAREILGIGLA